MEILINLADYIVHVSERCIIITAKLVQWLSFLLTMQGVPGSTDCKHFMLLKMIKYVNYVNKSMRFLNFWCCRHIPAAKTFFLSEDISIAVWNQSQYHISTANDGILHHKCIHHSFPFSTGSMVFAQGAEDCQFTSPFQLFTKKYSQTCLIP